MIHEVCSVDAGTKLVRTHGGRIINATVMIPLIPGDSHERCSHWFHQECSRRNQTTGREIRNGFQSCKKETSMKPTQKLHDLGQSLWLDNITRGLLKDGTLRRYIEEF